MAQAYINHILQQNPSGVEQEQINDLHFNDSDDERLLQATIEVENKLKRKGSCDYESHVEEKRVKHEFICDLCNKIFKHHGSLTRHMDAHVSKHECKKCGKSFTRKYNCDKHVNKCSGQRTSTCRKEDKTLLKKLTCAHCEAHFDDVDSLLTHVADNHPINQTGGGVPITMNKQQAEKTKSKRFRFKKSALNGTVNQVDLMPIGDEKYDLLRFLANVKIDVEEILASRQKKHRNIKWYVNARVEMVRDIDDGQQEKAHPHFRSKSYISLQNDSNDHNLNEAFQSVNNAMEEFINKGSNWILNKIICLEVHTLPYSPISGSSYIELPHKIKSSEGVVNIRNNDNKCFLWSVLAALHPADYNPSRVTHYKQYENELNMNGIEYPVTLAKMEKFEKQNSISVNVFGFEADEVFPLYLTKLENGYKEVDLLYFTQNDKTHYCWIKHLDRFLGSTTRFSTKRFYCRRCLHGFVRKHLLDEHRLYCKKFDFQKVTYPKEGEDDILEFKDFQKQMRVPFVIYADFECFTKKIDTCLPDPDQSSTTHTTKFAPCGYSYVVVSSNDKYSKPAVVYRGENTVEHFFESIFTEEEYIAEILRDPEDLIMNEETENQFQSATNCYVCNQLFTDKLIKVRDHDHLGVNGDEESPNYSNYRGAACQRCNLMLKDPPFIPVYFHNLRNFDGHLLLAEAGKYKDRKLTCIPNNMEKYVSFSVGKLRFLDTYQCMNSSLETLVENLASDGLLHFKQFRKAFPNEDKAKLMLQKNEYCYDYMDSKEKFHETQLPPKEAFYNSLTKEHISDEKYQHAKTVWNTFSMRNLGDFHDMYVLTDVLLLADVFERFRDMTLEYYKLDISHFHTSPGLAWQAALKMSGVCLDLITDPLMYNMIELGTRGGVSMVTKKYSKANHEYLGAYDEAADKQHIMYLDANNLYGFALSQPLPYGFFHFLDEDEIKHFELHKVASDAKEGYILEVDLEYPQHLHDEHNDYPLAPEHLLVEDGDLSKYSTDLWEKLNYVEHQDGEKKVKPRVKTKKLIPTLKNKKNYVVHYRNLQLYTELGMKITKIHRILGFHQKAWLKTYIQFNSNMRKQAKNDFEKDFFKLMCNRYLSY